MPTATFDPTTTEHDFARHVQDAASATDASAARAELVALMSGSHPVYGERGAAAIVRMRGWVVLALERVGVTDNELGAVLETLDNGQDPYLVAAAARALRTFRTPLSSFVPVVQRALARIRYSDESLTMQQYSGYALSAPATTATRELRATLRWLKPCTPRRHSNRGDSGPPPAAGSGRGDGPGDKPKTEGIGGSLTSAVLNTEGIGRSVTSPVLNTEGIGRSATSPVLTEGIGRSLTSAVLNTVASLGVAFFPKCVMCWTAYLSIFGIAVLERIPYAPWLLPLFIALMLVNIASLWPGQQGNVAAFALAVAGAQVILVLGIGCEVPGAAPLGLALSTAGSSLGVKSRAARQRQHAGDVEFARII